jgi:hypothetical protein
MRFTHGSLESASFPLTGLEFVTWSDLLESGLVFSVVRGNLALCFGGDDGGAGFNMLMANEGLMPLSMSNCRKMLQVAHTVNTSLLAQSKGHGFCLTQGFDAAFHHDRNVHVTDEGGSC